MLTRLRFTELRARYPGHVNFAHPRLASWREAAMADLQHVDEKVRAQAKWELGA